MSAAAAVVKKKGGVPARKATAAASSSSSAANKKLSGFFESKAAAALKVKEWKKRSEYVLDMKRQNAIANLEKASSLLVDKSTLKNLMAFADSASAGAARK